MPGQGIDIGDAVLHFLGDTTQLDAAFERINTEATGALQPAANAANQVGTQLEAAGAAGTAAGTQITAAGEQVTESANVAAAAVSNIGKQGEVAGAEVAAGMETATVSVRGTTEELKVSEEMLGVRLPRGVNRFVAELPGVQSAIQAAFSVGVMYFLIDALVQGAEKLVTFVADTFIFTDAMKKSNEITAAMSQSLQAHSAALAKLKTDYALLGLEGIAKTSEQLALLRTQINENNTAMEQLQGKALRGDPQAQSDYIGRAAEAKELQQQLLNLEKEGAQQRHAEQLKDIQTDIENEKNRDDSLSALKLQENRLFFAEQGRLNDEGARLDDQYHEELYQHEITFLQKKLQLAQNSGDLVQVAKLNTEIETKQREHDATMLKLAADLTNQIKQLAVGRTIPDLLLGYNPGGPFAEAEAAAKTLGITLSGTFTKSLEDAVTAYTRLKASGVATYDELQHALLKVAQAQLAFDRDMGNTAAIKADQKAVDDLTQSLARLEGTQKKEDSTLKHAATSWKGFFQSLQTESLTTAQKVQAAFDLIGQDIGKAITGAVEGSDTFGQAMEKMLKSLVAELAGEAIAYSIHQVGLALNDFAMAATMAANPLTAALAPGYTAAGHAHLAAAAKWGAAGAAMAVVGAALPSGSGSSAAGGSSSSAGTSGTTSGALQPDQQPVTNRNTQHFGAGLLTPGTLAVVNQSGNVVPIRDDGPTGTAAASSGTTINMYVNGVISADNLNQVARKLSQQVNSGKTRLTSSNSAKVTRRA